MVTVSLLLTTIISELHYSGSHHNRAPLPPWVKDLFFNRLSRYVGLADYVITREHVQDVVSELLVLDVGALQRICFPKIRDYYGSGWVGPGLTRDGFFF